MPSTQSSSSGSFQQWNRLADGMERFHSHFKWEYENVYKVSLRSESRVWSLERGVRGLAVVGWMSEWGVWGLGS